MRLLWLAACGLCAEACEHIVATVIFATRADPATSRLRYDCTRARNLGLHVLFVHCLTENGAMMHIARRAGMRIVSDEPEADAFLDLEPADAESRIGEAFEQAVGLFDYALKAHLAVPKAIAQALASPWAKRIDE